MCCGGLAGPVRPSLPCRRWQLPVFSPLLKVRVSKPPRGLWRQAVWRRALSMVVLVRAPPRAAPLGPEQPRVVWALSASRPPNAHPVRSPLREEIQEGNRSGFQCPGDRLAPQPPGPRSPAAALTVLPQSAGGVAAACPGASRPGASPAGGGRSAGSENKVLWGMESATLEQALTRRPGRVLLSPCEVGREGPQHGTRFTLALG